MNIFNSGEFIEDSVTEKNSATAADGKNYMTKFYNLDAIISVGYRVNSIRATQFRQWYEFYNQRFVIWQQPVAKLVNDNWATACCQIREQISQSASLNTNCQSSCLKTYKANCLPSKI